MRGGAALIFFALLIVCFPVSLGFAIEHVSPPDFASSNDFTLDSAAKSRDPHAILPTDHEKMTRQQCMKCHPLITRMLERAGAAHRGVACRACHQQYHVYKQGITDYRSILPKCSRCHGHPHGEELTDCSSCHSEAHTPLEIPASLSLAQGCYVCHEKLDRDIKTYVTRHTEFYCIACHHTKHGYIPKCTECHIPHTAIFPARTEAQEPATARLLADCVSCHPPHKALKVVFPKGTPNVVCALCHREAYEILNKSRTKHAALLCTRCHPGKHRTIKRCRQCHGEPHPKEMLRRAGTCGSCHGVAHSIIK